MVQVLTDVPVSRLRSLLISCIGVHHQFSLIVNIPPYHTPSINHPVEVMIVLIDTIDGTESSPITFTYVPTGAYRANSRLVWRYPNLTGFSTTHS